MPKEEQLDFDFVQNYDSRSSDTIVCEDWDMEEMKGFYHNLFKIESLDPLTIKVITSHFDLVQTFHPCPSIDKKGQTLRDTVLEDWEELSSLEDDKDALVSFLEDYKEKLKEGNYYYFFSPISWREEWEEGILTEEPYLQIEFNGACLQIIPIPFWEDQFQKKIEDIKF